MKTTLSLTRAYKDEDKLAPQAKAIVDAFTKKFVSDGKFPSKEVERKDVVDLISQPGVLTTRQEPARILAFYQPKFTELGIFEVKKHAEPKTEKTDEKDKDGKPKTTGAAPSATKAKDNQAAAAS